MALIGLAVVARLAHLRRLTDDRFTLVMRLTEHQRLAARSEGLSEDLRRQRLQRPLVELRFALVGLLCGLFRDDLELRVNDAKWVGDLSQIERRLLLGKDREASIGLFLLLNLILDEQLDVLTGNLRCRRIRLLDWQVGLLLDTALDPVEVDR